MRVLKHRRLHVNMGPYEHMETSATVEINTETDTEILAANNVDVNDLEAVEEFIDSELQLLLRSDVEDAHMHTSEEDSFIHEYHQEMKRK